MRVALLCTGAANLASVRAGLFRSGAEVDLVESAKDLRNPTHLVLPGVGALGPTRARLDQQQLTEVAIDWFHAGKPMLAICLGLHLLFERSEESPEALGLGLFSGPVRRFAPSLRVPQMGWNWVQAPEGARYLRSGHYYFANSFARFEPVADAREASVPVAWGEHGGPFVGGLEYGALLACQFHPELSGALGTEVLRRWLRESPAC